MTSVADLIALLGRGVEVAEPARDAAAELGPLLVLDGPSADGHPPRPRPVIAAIGTLTDSQLGAALERLAELEPTVLIARTVGPRARDWARRTGCAVLIAGPTLNWERVIDAVTSPTRADDEPDLFTIAEQAAAIIDGAVVIENARHAVIAYSSGQTGADDLRIHTLLQRTPPVAALRALDRSGVTRRLLRDREPFVVPAIVDGARPRVVVAVRSGETVLGSLWAVGDEPRSEQQLTAFRRCADRAAAHLVQVDAGRQQVRRSEVEDLARLLHGGGETTSLPSGRHTVLACAIAAPAESRSQVRAQLLTRLEQTRVRIGSHVLVGELNNLLYVVLSAPVGAAFDASLPARLADELEVAIGVGDAVDDQADLPRARSQAERALAVVRSTATAPGATARGATAAFADVWPQALLLRLARSPIGAELAGIGPVDRLLALDRQNGTDYAHTLHRWLLADRDARAAASELHVHANTVRYRLARLAELVPLRLDDPLVRLTLTLQLSLREIESGG